MLFLFCRLPGSLITCQMEQSFGQCSHLLGILAQVNQCLFIASPQLAKCVKYTLEDYYGKS